jgi:error-prone DNA polymerase
MSDLLSFATRERPQKPEPPPPDFVELVATSNFSFLHGGSHPEELVAAAGALGLSGFGLCDRNTFAGVVRAYVALRDLDTPHRSGFRYLVGTHLSFSDGTPDLVAYPTDREAFGRLCRLLTIGNARGDKGAADLRCSDLFEGEEDFLEGQQLILIADETGWERSEAALGRLAAHAPGRVWVAGHCRFEGDDRARLARLADLGRRHGAPLLATNNVLYHTPDRRPLQDAVTCIREHLTIYEAGRRLRQNAERHLKTPAEMARLFREHPGALGETGRLAARIGFALTDLRYNYPEETVGNGESAQETLERLTWAGAAMRYPRGIPEKIRTSLWSELCLIAYKRYAPYFLTVHDLVRFARHERNILSQRRGSAANSADCF